MCVLFKEHVQTTKTMYVHQIRFSYMNHHTGDKFWTFLLCKIYTLVKYSVYAVQFFFAML